MSNYKVKLHKIKAFAFDVDGVFTDGSIMCFPDGDLIRTYNAKDGFALRTAYLKGYPVAIITGGFSNSIEKRFADGLANEIYMKSKNKVPDFMDFCNKYNLDPSEVVFVGDDIPDIPILKICGLSVCPSDAVAEVKSACEYISIFPGGKGCVRDIIEQVLKVHNNWDFDPVAFSG